MAVPGTEPFSMSCESPKMDESSPNEIARALGGRPRREREVSSLVTTALRSFQDSSSSFKRNGVEPSGSEYDGRTASSSSSSSSSTIAFFTTVCGLLFITLLAAYLTNTRRRIGSISDLVVSCRTPECKLASGYLSTLVDRDVEPCDDFYQHVCGKWTRERDGLSFLGDAFQRYLADLRRRLTSVDVERSSVHPKLRAGLIVGSRFVRDCLLYMEEAEPDVKREVASILEVLDVSAILGSESSFDALLQALTLSFTTGLASMVGIRRRRSEGRVFLHIYSAKSIREELLPEATDRAVLTYLDKVVRAASGDRVRSDDLASSLLALDGALAQTAHVFSQSPDDEDAWLHVADLIGDPGFPAGLWDVAFGSFKANEPVRGHDNAVLFTGLNASRLVARHLERTLVNVTAWYLVAATLSRALRLDFVKRFGVNYPYRAEHLCLDAATRALEPDWPLVLVGLAFRDVDFAGAEALFDGVRRSSMTTMPEWLDNVTTRRTRKRLRHVTLTSFATSFGSSNATMGEVGSNFARRNRSFLAYYVSLHRLGQDVSIRDPPDSLKGALSSVELRGRVVYRDLYGTVFLPLVYLRHPIFYNASVASYYNYGTLGTILSKELAEAVSPFSRAGDIDDSGKDSEEGSASGTSLWSEASRREFSYRIGCYRAFEDHFHKGRPRDVDWMTAPLKRNLFAWLRAARVAYEAMRADYASSTRGGALAPSTALWKSAQMVFFRRFCLVACGLDRTEPLSARDRCHWPLLNMAEFVDAFGCPNNSFMASRQNCHFL
ncbi:neprilysin-1-like isoform X1 [Dermacentor variabilis]|uniref:neprilysin-1-like isoform X1 n=1 Tax=Dermacentor variabilis TaxID=34621 RepID=UPI003F5AEE33